jgi:PAS domain S-box-containing protein
MGTASAVALLLSWWAGPLPSVSPVSAPLETLGATLLPLALITLASLVLVHNRHASVNRRFAISALAIAAWTFTISSALSATDPRYTVLLGRLGFASASAIPFTLLRMFTSFQSDDDRRSYTPAHLSGVFCVAFMVLSLSPWIVAGATPGPTKANFVYGPLHPLFGVYFLLSFVLALYTLWKTTTAASGLRKLQLRYLLLGILLGGSGAITTNLLIPLFAGTSRYSAIGPYFSLLVVSFSAHAIIRYRLMDIRVVLRTGVVYACAILAGAFVFVVFVQLLKRVTGYDKDSIPLPEAVLVAIILAISFQPLKSWLQRSLNRYVYRETYDYQRTIRDASRRLSTMLDLDPLLDHLTHVVEGTFQTERVVPYLQTLDTHAFTPKLPPSANAWHRDLTALALPPTSPLVILLQRQQRILVREETLHDPADHLLIEAGRSLDALGGDIALPLTDAHTLIGFILVGPKRSGDPFFADDLDLLDTLIAQASVAMKNAQLYHHVVLMSEYVDNILSTMDSGVIAVDARGVISLFNTAAEHLVGLRARDIRGHSYDLLPTALASPLRETLHTSIPRSQLELSIPSAHGPGIPLVCSTATLKHRDASAHGALIVFSDLTRLKDLERQKRRSERLASFGALASGIAHEIKNPLVAIRTFAELLTERYDDKEFREDFSKVVIREIARIDDLVERLRGLAATTPTPLRAGLVDVRDSIRDTLALLRAQLEQRHATVHCDFQHRSPFVTVDEPLLKQLFLNLLLNSIEAIDDGGSIHVHVTGRESHGSLWVVVRVSDTGPGIPESIKTHIFDPFFTTKPRGSGLGLAICRGIMDAHHGTIRVDSDSNPAHGTIISVEFPSTNETDSLLTLDTSTH